MDAVTAPEFEDKLVMLGAATTVNDNTLLDLFATFTTTLPVVAVGGTIAVMEFALQFVGVAAFPLKVTVLVP